MIESNIVIVAPDTPLSDAIALMGQKQHYLSGCILVVAKEHLRGILTQKDVIKSIAEGVEIGATTVNQIMTTPVITVEKSQCNNLQDILSICQQHSLNYLPVLGDNQAIVGVITAQSLLQFLNSNEPKCSCPEKVLNTCFHQQQETELERFFDFAPSMLCIAGFDGYFKRINPAFNDILGFTTEELFAQPFLEFVHPEDRIATIAEMENLVQGKITISFENRYRTKNGNYRWFLWTAKPYITEQIIYAAAQDISEKQAALHERKEAKRQLQQERDFSHTIIDTVDALIAVLDSQGKIVGFNHTCTKITGYSFAEIKGKSIWEFLIAPEEKLTTLALFEQLVTDKVPHRYTNYWLAKDSTRHLISWSNTPLLDPEGKVNFVIATGIDITEQRRVWHQLEHQYRQTKLLADITRKIRMSIDIKELLQTTVTEVQSLLTCDRVLIVKISPQNTAIPISEAILPSLPPMLGYELIDPLLVGDHLKKYPQGEILAINDLSTASIAIEIKQLLKQFQIQAKLVVPIIAQSQLKGLLVAHQCNHPRNWQKNEVELLTQLADQIGVALSQAQLLENLESMVTDRTVELTTTNQLLKEEIIERKQTEIALRENQQKLQGILDNADEAIIAINEQQKIQLFNQGAEKIFGYKAGEIIGNSLDILLPKAYRQIHRQYVEQFGYSTEQSQNMTRRNTNIFGLRKNGSEFPAEATIAKSLTKEGALFTVMLKDITERQQAAAKLQASQNLLAKAEAIAKIGSWEYNLVTKQLSWSEELYKILDFPRHTSIPSSQDILARIHPEDLLLVQNTLRQGHQSGKPWHFNYRVILANGNIKYLESRGEPTVDAQGKVIKVWGTVMDISQRIQVEQSFQRSEQKLRLITDSLPVLIAYLDPQQRHLYNNHTYETWFGKPRSTLLGLEIKQLFSHAEYQKMSPYLTTVLSGKAVTFEIESDRYGSNPFWMNCTYIPDLDHNNRVQGFFSMISDITERKEIEQIKSEFVSIASHEMRTPLTSVHGVLKLLNAGLLGQLSPQGVEMAKMALKNSDRLISLINDILDLERMGSGKDSIEKTLCHSRELIQQSINITSTMAQKQEIILENDAQNLELWADGDRIVQALTNLITNAVKFSPDGSKITITCQQKADHFLFAVKDQGRGIPQDKLEIIFERFQQVDASDSRQKGGTGLGLAICRHIVTQHGGKIWAESIDGKGSTFFFSIPK